MSKLPKTTCKICGKPTYWQDCDGSIMYMKCYIISLLHEIESTEEDK